MTLIVQNVLEQSHLYHCLTMLWCRNQARRPVKERDLYRISLARMRRAFNDPVKDVTCLKPEQPLPTSSAQPAAMTHADKAVKKKRASLATKKWTLPKSAGLALKKLIDCTNFG